MTNQIFKASAFAFAAAVAMTGFANAQEASFDNASLMQTINADLDQQNEKFTLAVLDRADAGVQARLAKIDNVFEPVAEPQDFDFTAATADTGAKLEFVAMSSAEFEISKKTANIENPFEPRLPMAPVMIAIDGGQY
ncbi:hypothetical protein [Hyphococcus sp.]|uniref:hypothetical protein n=1 Tax=Hyphococcus sp. TaxID=2038636 RepID=UPI002081BF69|nr:MAG: hypothetical protein DHS20C04_26950 [Marinicaulis sp.]